MTTITVRHVSEDVRNELASRAARRGQSLQEFMLMEITRMAQRPAMEELVQRMRQRKRLHPTGVTTESILADLEADRR